MSDRPPIIGITAYAENERGAYYLPNGYVKAIRRAGGVPILLPPDETEIDVCLDLIDGLLLSGGGDIHPEFYNGNTEHKALYKMCKKRDRFELALANQAIKRDMPILAICRGLQIINTALGGTLHEHLPDILDTAVTHRTETGGGIKHVVQLEARSRLADILQTQNPTLISMHHQAIDQLGAGLVVSGRSEDEVIEAVDLPGHSWFVGIQWHPELSAEQDPVQQRIFDSFVAHINLAA